MNVGILGTVFAFAIVSPDGNLRLEMKPYIRVVSERIGLGEPSLENVIFCVAQAEVVRFGELINDDKCGPEILACIQGMGREDHWDSLSKACRDILFPLGNMAGVPQTLSDQVLERIWGVETGEGEAGFSETESNDGLGVATERQFAGTSATGSPSNLEWIEGTEWRPDWDASDKTVGYEIEFINSITVSLVEGVTKPQPSNNSLFNITGVASSSSINYEIQGDRMIFLRPTFGGGSTKEVCRFQFTSQHMILSGCSRRGMNAHYLRMR